MQGFAHSSIADTIIANGAWRIGDAGLNSYNEKMPGFSLLWAATAELGGLHPLVHVQLYLALITSTCVLVAYLIGLKATGRRLVGFMSSLFLALFGSFLMLTSTVTKEAIGLVILPVAVLLFHERRDPRKRVLSLLLLILLPFVHHLTTLLTLGMVAALTLISHRRALARGRFSMGLLALDVATIGGPTVISYLYYESVNMSFLSEVTTSDAMTLLLAVFVLVGALLAGTWRPARAPAGRRLASAARPVLLVPAAGFAVLVANAQTNIFVGGSETRPALLQIVPWLVVLAGFALIGYYFVRRTSNRVNDLVLSMLAAPAALILFGFLRGLDSLSFTIVYRTADFLDYGIAVLVGIGFLAVWTRLGRSRAARAVLAAGFLAALLGTTPMAYDHPAVFGVDNVVTTEEFQALAFVASLGAQRIASEPRLTDVAATWFGIPGDSAFLLRLQRNESITGVDYAVVLERWSVVGTQVRSIPDVVIDAATLAAFLEENRILRADGPTGDRVFVVQVL